MLRSAIFTCARAGLFFGSINHRTAKASLEVIIVITYQPFNVKPLIDIISAMRLIHPLSVTCVSALVSVAKGFSLHQSTHLSSLMPSSCHQHLNRADNTRIHMSSAPENPLEGGELLSTLASLEREWTLQQQAEGADSRWKKLLLPTDRPPVVSRQAAAYQELQEFVYILTPPSGEPEFIIPFVGGAGEYTCLLFEIVLSCE